MDKTVFLTGPDPQLELIYSDVWLPGVYSRRVLCFELPNGSSYERAIAVIERGLKSLVQGTPELGGVSVVVPANKEGESPWRAIKPYKGIELVVKDLRTSYKSFKQLESAGFPITEFKDQELLPIKPGINPEPQPILKIQMNLVEGGILMGFCAYHHLTDGNGMNSITLALAEECSRATETSLELPPRVLETDRSILSALTGSKTDISQHAAYSIVKGAFAPAPPKSPELAAAPPEAAVENGHDPGPEIMTRLYRLDHSKAVSLKKDASTQGPISTHDAITALMWRTLIKARRQLGHLEDGKLSTFTIPVNARKYLGLSKDWIGNCTYFIAPSLSVAEIAESDSLPKLASLIRAEINKIDKDTVGGVYELRKPQTYDVCWWPFMVINNPEIFGATSFYHSELYSDFGPALGTVKHFTTTDAGAVGGFGRAAHVGAKLPGGPGVDVALGLDSAELELVEGDEVWNKHFRKFQENSHIEYCTCKLIPDET